MAAPVYLRLSGLFGAQTDSTYTYYCAVARHLLRAVAHTHAQMNSIITKEYSGLSRALHLKQPPRRNARTTPMIAR